MATFTKPRFIDPAGDPATSALFVKPPFLFRNTTARSFPLRANMAVLTNFCNNYLNMDIDPSIVHYAPALPYVYLTILNYGSMAAASVQAQNVGWVSQHEVAFMVVVQRWRKENGKLVFKDWATVSPFIYVDDQLSLNTGREVYGWNKVGCQINADVPLWATDPRSPLRQFDLSIVDFARPFAGDEQSDQTLLQVDLDPPPTFTEFPPDPRNPWSPIWSIPNAIANTASLLGSVADISLSLRVRGFEDNRNLKGVLAMAAKAGDKLRSALPGTFGALNRDQEATDLADAMAGLPKLFLDSVTLKQFRNAEDPSLACYQALVNSKMGVDRVNRVGLIGDINLLRGDSSGGYTIRIHQHDSQPIIQTLGLSVDSWSAPSSSGCVANLKPVLPMWLDVDLYYGKGDVICSRAPWGVAGPTGGWQDEQKDRLPREPLEPSLLSDSGSDITPGPVLPPLYNTALGAATQPVAGPFHFPDVTAQVYPLLADPEKLASVVQKYLNDPLSKMYVPGTNTGLENIERGWRFEPFGSYVYMAVVVCGDEFGQMWSNSSNIGDLFNREVTFGIPVKWYDGQGELVSLAMIEPFMYSNNGRAVTTDREVDGYNATAATIDSPRDPWLSPNGPIAKRRFLSLATEVIPALNAGQRAQQRTLMEIDEYDILPANDAAGWRVAADGWGRQLIDELKRKTRLAATQAEEVTGAKALALELLANGMPINRLIFKQYRDSEDLDGACYQALVHGSSTITSVYDVREIDAECHVRLYRQPGHPITEALGLKIKRTESSGGEVIDILQPLRPFWMRYATRDDLSTVACYRAEEGPWQNVHPWFSSETSAETPGDAAAPRRLAGQKPFFRRTGSTRVGRWLGRAVDHPVHSRPTGSELQSLLNSEKLDAWYADRLVGEIGGANLNLDLKNKAAGWLRKSLSNQLTWIRLGVDALKDSVAKTKFLKSLNSPKADAGVVALFACPLAPGSLHQFCEARAIRDLERLRTALEPLVSQWDLLSAAQLADNASHDHAAPSTGTFLDGADFKETEFWGNFSIVGPGLGAFLNETTQGVGEDGLVWSWEGFFDSSITSYSLISSLVQFQSMNQGRVWAMLLMFPPEGVSMLKTSAAYFEEIAADREKKTSDDNDHGMVNLEKLNNSIEKMKTVKLLAEMIEERLLDWMAPSRWLPISHGEATTTITSLQEMQVVVDNILSSEWENRGVTRWLNPRGGRKPDEYVIDSPDVNLHAVDQGLKRWVDPLTQQDSGLWVAQPQVSTMADFRSAKRKANGSPPGPRQPEAS